MSLAEAYDPATRWGRAFGYVDWSVYTNGSHRGQDVRKLAPGGGWSVPADVVSLSAGRVSHLFTARSTGREVVVDTGRARGRYEIHCHCAYFPRLGVHVDAGDTLTVNATASQQPGTGWGGPHDHLVISDYPDAAHVPSRPVYDPRTFIVAALARTAGGDSRPLPTPTPTPAPPEEDTIMRYLFCRDQGGTGTLWTLVNTSTGEMIQTRDQSAANGWAKMWGNAHEGSVQDFLNALDAVRKTTKTRATAESIAALDAAIADLQAQIDAGTQPE